MPYNLIELLFKVSRLVADNICETKNKEAIIMNFTAKDISEAIQVNMPKARAIIKVCNIWLKGSWDNQQHCIEWLDKACDTYGLEHLCEESQDYPDCNEEIEFDYLNAGDTYASTLIFLDLKYGPKEVLLSTWGDVYEQWGRDKYEELGQPRAAVCPDCNHHCFYADSGASRRLESLKCELQCPNCLKSCHY